MDLRIPRGALWGILGPNGAGKTTLLALISNLLSPEAGEIRVLGKDFRDGASEICSRINLSSGHANFLWSLTVRENLDYYAMLYGISGEKRRKKVETLLELLDLREFARSRFEELSTGTKQKLSLAKALINDPELLLLDEPTVGLDPDVARRIRGLIADLHRDDSRTILLTTHNMREAELLCEHVTFIQDGMVRASGAPRDLKRGLRLGDAISIDFGGALRGSLIERMEGIYAVRISGHQCRIDVDDHRDRLPQILDRLTKEGISIQDVRIQESDLEDVFLEFAK